MRMMNGLLLAFLILPTVVGAAQVEITGRFLYEDRLWDKGGYTGTVQDLPIRRADVEVVQDGSGAILASGSTDANGEYSLTIDLSSSDDLYVRCLSATENNPNYPLWVVDTFIDLGDSIDISESVIHAITSETQTVDPAVPSSGHFGSYLIQDDTGFGIAQAFNILDNAIDCCDHIASPIAIGRFPNQSEYLVYSWNGSEGSPGTGYVGHGIYIASSPADTNGWADVPILHETGHWVSHMFGADHSPGGDHSIGDNYQDPRLSYGEGYATLLCAQVREWRSSRLNDQGQPIDDHVSLYGDLTIPPPLPDPGGMQFWYDIETGIMMGDVPIGQIGSACETNVTSAMWDLIDGLATRDESPGEDDDPGDETGEYTWDVVADFMPMHGRVDWLTVEDFYDGWFIQNGSGFMQEEIDSAFVGLGQMPFYEDSFESDNTIGDALLVIPLTYNTSTEGGVVINECDLDENDGKVELYNSGLTPVDLTGWKIQPHRNGFMHFPYEFPSFTLYPGMFVVVHEGGSADDNGPVHLYDQLFVLRWIPGDDGACTLEDAEGVAIDFLRWDNLEGGDPSEAPIPPGLQWNGTLDSAPKDKVLARDKEGTDTDNASDFSVKGPSAGSPNFDELPRHSIFPESDQDVIAVDLAAGDLLVIQAYAPHSMGEPVLELLDAEGNGTGPVSDSHGIYSLAEIQVLAPNDTTVHARVMNDAPYTFYTPIDLAVFRRPSAYSLYAPSAVVAVPENASDADDVVALTWLNGGVYDSVRVLRDDSPLATLAGDATAYVDEADRGLYQYGVQGLFGGTETEAGTTRTFAGTVPCYTFENLELGIGNLVLEGSWGITEATASEGLYSLTDSPSGDYADQTDVAAELVEPAEILTDATLEFDHICIAQAESDIGYVEISKDFGNSWTRLTRHDMDDHPGWSDGAADPEDWFHETIDLQDYVGEMVRIRFRLVSDDWGTRDGWYVDNIWISSPDCSLLVSAPSEGIAAVEEPRLEVGPNPFPSTLKLVLDLPTAERVKVSVYDVGGRLVRTLHNGLLESRWSFTWNGQTDRGRPVASGLYWIRVQTEREQVVQRVIRIR